jgi:hypothetical protein
MDPPAVAVYRLDSFSCKRKLCHVATESVNAVNVLQQRKRAMAKNAPPGDNRRIGAVKDRSQVHNPKNDRWTKRDSDTGQFIDQKADKAPFKGVRKEK